MKTENLLVELFVEELPPKALKKLGQVFAQSIRAGLLAQGLLDSDSKIKEFATPRRLGVWLSGVKSQAAAFKSKLKIMPTSVGLNANGEPTAALIKKLQSLGIANVDISDFLREMDGKSEALFYERNEQGVLLEEGLQRSLNDAIKALPIPKMMSYQLHSGCELPGWTSVEFVRPAHSLIALHGGVVVNVKILGLQASRLTRGHRFEGAGSPIEIAHADEYEQVLEHKGAVVASFMQRRNRIDEQLQRASKSLGEGFQVIEDAALLDEVCALVEWPNVLVCQFEAEYLRVPQECLILTMKANQKYFPLTDPLGRLTNKFLVVSNIAPSDSSAVVQGNERVVRPRLADAQFFYEQDQKKKLAHRLPGLSKVVYHNLLGTQAERVERVQAVASLLCRELSLSAELTSQAQMAATLAKADLMTEMVSEFPELQGVMGHYYALNEGLPLAVAEAIEDHYKPRFSGDQLARSEVGVVVALADKLETLVGMFSIGQGPSGDKDPFALRRHALGIIRMLVERELPIDLTPLIQRVVDIFKTKSKFPPSDLIAHIKNFLYDRLSSNLKDQGFSVKEVDSVISQHPELLAQVPRRVKAVQEFSKLSEAPALAAANKRISNILKKEDVIPSGENDSLAYLQEDLPIDLKLLTQGAEQDLYETLKRITLGLEERWQKLDFSGALVELAALKEPTDAFFDQVMVNDPNLKLRKNRLALLHKLYAQMNKVADLAKLA